MIDFRYHLVSLVSVFLALAIGIVLGTTALKVPVTKGLTATNGSLRNENQNLRASTTQLQLQVQADGALAQAAAPRLLANQLSGQRVVLVTAPGAPGQVVDGVQAMLQQAGATITGQVGLQGKFFDTGATTLSFLDALAQQTKPAALALPNGTAQQHASQVLASAIVTRSQPGQEDSASDAILYGFAQGGFLSVSGKPGARATLAVVITGQYASSASDADPANQSFVALATALNSASLGAVVAAPQTAAQSGGTVAALRASSAANQVSTVDNADTPTGQIIVVMALRDQMQPTGKAGSYGIGSGASGFGPSPLPTPPAPTGTTSPRPAATAHATTAAKGNQ